MQKILIVSHSLELGGAERSLIGLLDALDTKKIEVHLFLLRHEGELMQQIPSDVKLLPSIPAYTVLARPMKDTLLEGHFLLTSARVWGKWKATQYDKKHQTTDSGVGLEYSHKYTYRFMPKIQPETEYDLAISFLTPHYIVANKVKAKKKIAWIHTDYRQIQIDTVSEYQMWSKYDRIVSISNSVTEGFIKVFPELSEKIMLMENVLSENMIWKQMNQFDATQEMPRDGSIRLLSIGRYCHAKNFDNVPEICSILESQGLNIKWYLIGFGQDENVIREKIKKWRMEKKVILLGKKENPYPYIKECDLYIQPSRYEGKSVTVREAQMLRKPVIITAYATSSSQLKNDVDGIIVPMDNDGCALEIAKALRNPGKMTRIVQNCRKEDYSNRREVEKLYRFMEE